MVAQWTANPFWQLPDEFRLPTWEFWAFWSQQLKDGQLALAVRIRQWLGEGLVLAELKDAFAEINSPRVAAELDNGGVMLAALSARVGKLIADRRAREKEARFKADAEAAKRGTAPRAEFSRLLESIGSMGDE